MKRLATILALAILLAGLVPLALAQEPAGPTPAPAPGAALLPAGAAGSDAILYFSDFEGNNGGFAGTLDWEWGTYSWVGNGCYGTNYPPPGAYSGTDMWGTVLNTCYNNLGNNQGYADCNNTAPGDDSILSLTIDLTGATAPITMTWWEWYDLFSNWDWAEVYANGNVVFQHCEPSHVIPTAWVQQSVDLSPYAGGPLTIEFHMMASTVVNYAGWYIDDVMISSAVQPPIVWEKAIDGEPWAPGMEITRQTSDTIVVQEVLHLTPPPPAEAVGSWDPNRPEPDRSGYAIEGIASDSPAPAPFQAAPHATPPPPGATIINFDDAAQPCNFVSTVALRGQYAGVGVLFMGPAPLDGGGVLDQCGNFGVAGYSAPNFLAFNRGSAFADGGIPRPPEIITFTNGAMYVQINAGSDSGAGQTVTMEAFDAGGALLGSDSLVLAATLDTLSITATHIAYVVIDTPATVVVLDDLAFLPELPPAYAQVEFWDPAHLHLLDWAATGGTVIVNPGQVEWTGEILAPQTITLTKWFHVEPCTWTQTLLLEELWLEGMELEQRPVVINKLPPDLWIDSSYDPLVCPGAPGQFILDYGNLGGYENQVLVRNEFPPTAPFAFSTPPPDNEDPAGLWAEWLVGDLPQGAAGRITVTVAVTDNVLPGDVIAIYDWIYDHVGEPRDEVETQFTVGAPDVAVNPPALWAELCPDGTGTLLLAICNVGPCLLDWTLVELTPTLWLSVDPAAGVLPPGVCQTVTVSLNAAGLAPGDYLAGLVVDSNDPETPQVAVPVTLTVSSGAEILTVTTAIADLTVTFTAEVEGPEPLEYLWDFGDGVGTSTETNPVYTYAAADCYTVTLDVTSPCGGDSWTGEVCVGQACDPPSGADFSWSPDEPIMGEVVHFTGTVAAGSAPIVYAWAFGDGDTGTGGNPTHVYDAAGTYTVWMTATNDCGEDTATYDIVVVEGCVAPADVDFTWSPTAPLVGEAAHFTATVGMGTLPLDYAWDFGDGSGATGSPTVGYIYSGAGAFTVTVVVSNTCGSATMAHPLVVQAVGSSYAIYLPLVVRP